MAHLDTVMLGGVMKLLVFRHEEKSEIDKNNCTIIIRCKTNHKNNLTDIGIYIC